MSKLSVVVEQDPNRFDSRTGEMLPSRETVWIHNEAKVPVALMSFGAKNPKAEAAVFSAAPEMLEALKIAASGCPHSTGMRYCTPCWDKIEAAIAKAEGRES